MYAVSFLRVRGGRRRAGRVWRRSRGSGAQELGIGYRVVVGWVTSCRGRVGLPIRIWDRGPDGGDD